MIKLSRDTYPNLKDMLNSSDRESVVLGLTCIEESEFKPNVMYIGLLFLECNVIPEMWKVHAPNVTQMLRAVGFDIMAPPITYKKLLVNTLKFTKEAEDLRLFFNAYADNLKAKLNEKLIDTNLCIDELIITIKTNKDEARTISQGSQGTDTEGTLLRDVSDNAEQEVE